MKKIFLTGGSGMVGSRFIDLFAKDFQILAPTHEDLDLLDFDAVEKLLIVTKPDVVVNFAAVTNLDQAEVELDDKTGNVYKLNSLLPELLAKLSKQLHFYLIQISTDYVFDGAKSDSAYTEDDEPNPLCWYAQTKLQGERFVKTESNNFTIVRIEMPFSDHYLDKKDFARFFLESLQLEKEITVVEDQKITPIFVDDCVIALKRIIEQPTQGILHVASTDWTTPFDFANHIAEIFELNKDAITPVKFADFNSTRIAPRPKDSWLEVSKFQSIYGKGTLEPIHEELLLFKAKIETQKTS